MLIVGSAGTAISQLKSSALKENKLIKAIRPKSSNCQIPPSTRPVPLLLMRNRNGSSCQHKTSESTAVIKGSIFLLTTTLGNINFKVFIFLVFNDSGPTF